MLTFWGHSCFLFQTGGTNILLDPYFGAIPSDSGIDMQGIRIDYVFISHAHEDHTGSVMEVMAINPDAVIVAVWEVVEYYSRRGFKTHAMNIGGSNSFPFGVVKLVLAVHSSSFPDGSHGGQAAGFVFNTPEGVIYFAGDTALHTDMQLIPLTCPALDIAILPIGSNFTMDYQDAVHASNFIRCNRIIGCHYDTFESIRIDREKAVEAFRSAGKDLELMAIGATLTY